VATTDSLRVSIVGDAEKLRKSLQSSQQQVGKFASKTESASRRTGKLKQATQRLGSSAGKMGKAVGVGAAGAVGALGAGAVTAAAGVGKLVSQTAKHADRSIKTARAVGVEVETYQELEFALGQYGLTQQETEKTMTKFIRRIGEAKQGSSQYKEAVDKLGLSLKDQSGEMRSQGDLFNSAIKRLGEMENAQDRAAVAADLFGQRAGPKLASAIEDGAEGVDELRNRAQELGIVVGEESAKQAEKFNDSLDDLKKSGMGLVRSLGAELIPILNDTIIPLLKDSVIPAIKNVTEWLGPKLKSGVSGAAGILDDVKEAFDAIMDAFGEGGLGAALSEVGDQFAEVWPDIRDALGTVLSNVGDWIADNAPVVARKLADWAEAFIEWVKPQIPPLLDKLGDLLEDVGKWLIDTGLPTLGRKLAEWADAFVAWVGPKIPPLLDELGSLLGELVSWLREDALPNIVGKLDEWAASFVDWVAPKIPPMLEELRKLLGALITWVVTDALPTITKKLVKWAVAFAEWVVTDAIPTLLENLGKLLAAIVTWATTDALPALGRQADSWVDAFVDWVDDAITSIPAKLEELADTIIQWAKELPGKISSALGDLGSNIADAAGRGLSRAGSWANPFGDGPGVQGSPSGGSAMQMAQQAIDAVPGKQYVTSAYRTPAENRRVNGSPTSLHLDEENPAVDIGGENLPMVFAWLARAGGKLRELLGPQNAADHQDHVHIAHRGGQVAGSWPRLPGDKPGERTARLQVGETVVPRQPRVRSLGAASFQLGRGDHQVLRRLDRLVDAAEDDQPVVVELDGDVIATSVSSRQGSSMRVGARAG